MTLLQPSKPNQYIKGWVEFYKLRFKVTPDVLIPRPETELLVDEILSFLQTTNYKLPTTILDIGTGSGNIAISIAKNVPQVQTIATDVSAKALKIARQNSKFHGIENKIIFLKSNLLDDFLLLQKKVINTPIIMVANLPYIPSARIPTLDSSVKDFEPLIALDGGEDGFELYRKLFSQIKKKGWKFKLLIGEIDYTHGELAVNEALKYFPEYQVGVKTDLAQKQRILKIIG